MLKSNYFKIKEKYGGGVTSQEEIEAILNRLFAKGFLERRLEKNGEFSYKEKEGVDKDAIVRYLESNK